jgi:hypothetical protein
VTKLSLRRSRGAEVELPDPGPVEEAAEQILHHPAVGEEVTVGAVKLLGQGLGKP